MYKIINRKKLLATTIADAIGSLIFFPRLLRTPESINPDSIKSILVIRTAYVGDVVMTLPILKPLKDRFPGAKITFLTSTGAKPVIENNPYVDEIVTFNPFWFYQSSKSEYFQFIRTFRKRKFDLVIEARGDIRDLLFIVEPLKSRYKIGSGIGGGRYFLTHVVPYRGLTHRVEYHLDLVRFLGCDTKQVEWGIHLTDGEKKEIGGIFKKYAVPSPFICVHPGARLPLKRWSPEKCATLYDMIMEKYDLPMVIMGVPDECVTIREIIARMKHKPIDLGGRLTLRQFVGVVSQARLFICNDSAPMHIAAAMKTPTVAIFGPSKSRETGPYGAVQHRVVEKEFPCRFTCDESTCLYRVHNACMHAIMPDDVFDQVKELMASPER